MKLNQTRSLPAPLLAVVITLFSLSASVQAQVSTWSGNSPTPTPNWSDGGNWDTVPVGGANVVFSGTTQTISSNDISGLSLGWLWLNNGGYSIGGNPLTLTGGITNSFDGNTLELNVTFSGAQAIEADAGTLTFSGLITNTANLVINGSGTVAWSFAPIVVQPQLRGLIGPGNLIVNGPAIANVNGGWLYPTNGNNFAGNTIVNNGAILNVNAGCFDGNSPIGQSLTINPGGYVQTTQPHIAGSSGRPLSIYGGTLDMEGEAYFTTVVLSNATLSTSALKDLRGNGSFTNLASAGMTTFGVSLSLTSSRVVGVDLGAADPAIDFTGNGTQAIQGSGNLTKVGPGKMRISAAANHTGTTTISAGTVVLQSSMSLTPVITVASNAIFDISSTSFSLSANQTLAGAGYVAGTLGDDNAGAGEFISPGGNGVAGTFTLGGLSLSGNVALNFDLSGTSTTAGGGTNDLLVVTNLTLSSGNTNTVNLGALSGSLLQGVPYTLIKYTNCSAPAGLVTTLASPPSHFIYNFTNDTVNNRITVTITGNPFDLVWKGDGVSNAWDIVTTTNWLNSGVPIVYYDGDKTTFSDVGSNNVPLNLTTTLKPTTLTVNATKDYVFNGSGKISGGTMLVKNNSGNLTLLTANDFTGGGSLNGSGAVTVGNGGPVPANLGSGSLTNNTKVAFFNGATTTYFGNMSGSGSLNAFMSAGTTLTLTGSNSFTGGLTIANGTVQIGNNPAIAGATVAGSITNYGTLYISRSDAFTNQNNITSAGNTLEYGNGDINIRGAGGMTVDGSGSINTLPQGSLNIGQGIYGKLTVNASGLITLGSGLYLGNPNNNNPATTSGDLVQNGGTINVGNQVRLGHYATNVCNYIMNGGILNVPNNQLAVGWDGYGLMFMNGGTVNCRALNVDDNGNTVAYLGTNSTFTMTGGTINIGTGGIGGNTATNALVPTIVLSGGTIGTLVPAAFVPAGWSSVMFLRLTNGTPTIDTSNSVVTLSGILSGNGGLTKQGTGYLYLNSVSNSYAGTTTVSNGTLQGSGAVVGPTIVQSGANLSAGAINAIGTFTVSNLTMNTGANLVIDASSTATNCDFVYVKGNLALDAATPVFMNFLGGTPYNGGSYLVVSNLLARTGHLVLAASSLTRYTAAVDESNPNRIQVSFTGTNANLVWKGNVSTNWNVNADANWLNAGVADKYYQSDAVFFDDSGISQSNVFLSATMTPAKVSVDTAGNYAFTGGPIAGAATLTKSGSGKLTLVNNNTFAGLTTIAGGTLQIGNGGTTGSLNTNAIVQDYGSLVFNRSDTAVFNGTLNGPGTLTQAGSGTLLITATQNHYGGSTVNPGTTVQLGNGALADSGSFGNSTVTNNGTINFYRLSNVSVAAPYTGGGNFNFLGTGNAGQSGYILNATNTFTGPVTLNLARIQSGLGAQSFGSPSSITVNPGSQIYAVATPQSPVYNLPVTIAGTGWQDGLGALRLENGVTWSGPVTLAANARIGVNNATTNFVTGNITGNYELETYGGAAAAALVLAPASANTYNALRVSIGTAASKLIAGNASAIPNNIPLTMNGGTLWLNGFSKTFSSFLNLSGSSSIQNGSTTSPATVTLTPVLGPSSYNGTFADGGTQPLNVALTQTPGLWGLTLATASPNWTGSLTNNGGFITNNLQNTGFGSQSVLGRSIVGNNGATFVTTINNVFNGYNGNVVLNNSTWVCNRYISFAPNAGYLYLANSTVTGTNSVDGSYAAMQLPSVVTIRGTAPSYISGVGSTMGFDLQSGGTTFDVADVTGTANSDLIVGGGTSTAFIRNLAATSTASTLIKTGAGTLELDGVNTYTGPTFINAGTLALGASGTIANTPKISIAGGAKLDVLQVAGGLALSSSASQTLTGSGTIAGSVADAPSTTIQPGDYGVAGTLTINNNLTLGGSGVLNIDLSNSPGSGNDKIVVNGNLTLGTGTPVNLNFLNGAPAMGTPYTLIQCGGTISGTAATAFTNSPTRFVATYSQSGNSIVVTFSGSASNLVWTGTDPVAPATWDVASSTNWFDGSSGNIFYQFDTVRFDDSSVNNTVSLNSTVTPAGIVVDSTNNYTITGSGSIAGSTGITKNNTNTLTLSTANTFTGPVVVKAGTLALGVNNSLPVGTVVTVSNGAAFDFANYNGTTTTRGNSFVIAGSGPGGLGAMLNSVAGGIASYANVSNLTLTADSVIGGIARWDIGSVPNSKVDGQGHNLIKVGSAPIDMRAQIITNVASITVSNGLLWYENYSQTNSWTATTTNYIQPGAQLGDYGGVTVGLPIVLNSATILNYGGGTPVWNSSIVVSNSSLFRNDAAQNFYGVISGPGGMWVDGGTSPLILSNANSYAGGTIISNAPITTAAVDATIGSAAVIAANPSAFGVGPVTINGLNYSALTTNATWFTTNVLRAVEFGFSAPGTVPNNIVLPAGTVANVSLDGRDSGQVINLAGVISGGFAGLTNWVDFADANATGVMRYGNTANTFLGNVTTFRGLLAITADGSLGNAANILRLNSSGGLRFDAAGITLAHTLYVSASTTFSVFGDNNGDGILDTANNAIITGALGGTSALNLNIGGGTNIAGTCYGSLTLNNNNTNNSQITVLASTKLIGASASSLGGASYFCIVNAGGTLSLNLNGTYNTKALQLSGSGVTVSGAGVGALENLSGNNTDNSTIQLNSASSIGLTAGSLTLGGAISGAYPLTITAASPANTLTLGAAETYTSGTIINGGTVLLNGSLPAGNSVAVNSGAVLGGSGTINCPVTVSAGATLQPGAGGSTPGKLIVNGPLNLGGNTVMFVNKSTPTNSQIAGLTTVIYGGALSVTNLGGSYIAGDSFKLFSAVSYQGAFTATNLPNISPLAFQWSPANGTLSVVSGVNLTPTNITTSVSGGLLTLSWPADRTGWTLQAQTNTLSVGLYTNWAAVAGSTTTNSVTVPVDSAQPTVFYRLYHP